MSGWEDALQELALEADSTEEGDLAHEHANPPQPLVPPDAGMPLDRGLPAEAETMRMQVSTTIQEALRQASHLEEPHLQPFFDYILHRQGEIGPAKPSAYSADVEALATDLMKEEPKLHTSKEALAQRLGIAAHKLEPTLGLLTNCLLHLDRISRFHFEELLALQGSELLMYLDVSRYDETPMKVTHDQQLPHQTEAAGGPANAEPAAVHPGAPGASGGHVPSTHKIASVSKMLSTEQKFVCVIKVPAEQAPTPEDRIVTFFGSTLSWNQILSKASGLCIYQGLQETSGVTKHSSAFPFKVRVCTTDAAGANFQAERYVRQSRGASWAHLHLACNAHKAAKALSKGLTFLEPHIEGMVNMALSLRVGAAMMLYREALVAVVESRPLRVQRGPPPMEIVDHQQMMLDLLLQTGSRQSERYYLLSSLLTGDWRKADCLEIYVPLGIEINEVEMRQCVAVMSAQASLPEHTNATALKSSLACFGGIE